MNDSIRAFLFRDDLCDAEADGLVVDVPVGCSSRDELFNAFKEQLGFPDYFGGNWDAFSDALRDLSWIDYKRIVLRHSGKPLVDRNDLRVYLTVLIECITDWERDDRHELVAVFPRSFEAEARSLLDPTGPA